MVQRGIVDLPESVFLVIFRCSKPRTLAAVARSCKSLSSLALSQLWYRVEVEALNHLIDAYVSPEVEDVALPGRRIASKQFSMAHRWQRFSLYASFIKIFNLVTSTNLDSEDFYCEMDRLMSSIDTLVYLAQSMPLFPNLQAFQYKAMSVRAIEQASVFLGPKLERVLMPLEVPEWDYTPGCDVALGAFIDMLPIRTPHLQRLILPLSVHTHPLHVPAIIRSLQALPELWYFGTGTLGSDPSIMRSLAHHNGLRELVIKSEPDDRGHFDLATDAVMGKGPLFAALETFELDGDPTPTSLARLFRYINTSPLRQLTLRVMLHQLDATGVGYMADSIATNCPHLQIISLTLGYFFRADYDCVIDWEWFTGLLRCHELKSFTFHSFGPYPFDLTDKHIDAMGTAWPCLRDIQVQWGAFDNPGDLFNENSVTLASVLSLTRRCPRLERICLTYFGTAKISAVSVQESAASDVRLELVICSDLEKRTSAAKLAFFLSSLRSHVSITFHEECGPHAPQQWEAVRNEIAAIRSRQAKKE